MQNVAVLPRIIVGEHSVSDLLVYTKCLKSFDPTCLIILMMYLLAGIVGGPVVSLDTVGVLPKDGEGVARKSVLTGAFVGRVV